MYRDIFALTRTPELREKWIKTTVEYIRKKYGDPPAVDAIIGPHTKGNVFALVVACKLRLPYIVTREAGKTQPDSDDEVILHGTYVNRENKVFFLLYNCRSVVS